MPLRIRRQQTARRIERLAMTDAGEDIEDFTLILRRIVDSTRSQQRQVQRTRNADRRTVAMLFLAVEVALQFDIDITRAEDAVPTSRLPSVRRHSRRCANAAASGPSLPPVRHTSPLLYSSKSPVSAAPSAFVSLAQLETGNEAAKVLIAGA